MTPQQFLDQQDTIPYQQRLEALVAVLRGPGGCPWDQRQTAASIIDYVIDEAHELKEALGRGDHGEITDELGDLAFTMTFLGQTLADQVSQASAVDSVVKKMITRHPHVFVPGAAQEMGETEIKRQWESLKGQTGSRRRLDDDLPASLPTWKKAAKILSRARNAGFRYDTPEAAWEKVAEEWFELQEALDGDDAARCQAELGDLLLALLTASVEAGLDAEAALSSAGKTLSDRIEKVEELAGRALCDIPRHELANWYARSRERKDGPTAYFNYCGVSPWPGEVFRAIFRAARTVGRRGLPGALQLLEERRLLRPKIARLVGASSEDVVLVPNVSSAALAVGYCLDWKAGDALLLGRHEFPANTVPWRQAAQTFGLKVVEFDDDLARSEPCRGWELLSNVLFEARPRLVALSAVSYWSGYRWPIDRLVSLCKEAGAMLYLDAIQALGTVPVDMSFGVDFLAGGSHKALMAPEGAGFLVVGDAARTHWIPRLTGWLGLPQPVDFLLAGDPGLNPNLKSPRSNDPTTLEGGSQNALGYAGLSAALDHLEGHGIETVVQHVQRLHDLLEPRIAELGFESLRSADQACRSSILSFAPPAGLNLPKFQGLLSQAGVEISIPRGHVRFGLHFANTEADVARAIEVIGARLKLALQ